MVIRISPLLFLVIALILIIHASTAAIGHSGGETCVSYGSFHHCGTNFELAFDQNGQPVILHPGDPGYYKP